MISALLEVKPTMRLTASQALQNSWLLHAAASSDQEEVTDTSNIIMNKKGTLKPERRKHVAWGNQHKPDMSADIGKVAQSERSSTNKYREINMDRKCKQTAESSSQVRGISKNGHVLKLSALEQKADIPK